MANVRKTVTPAAETVTKVSKTAADEAEAPKRRRRSSAKTATVEAATEAATETPTPRRRRPATSPVRVTKAHEAAMEVARELLTGSYSRVEIVSATEVLVR